MKYSIFLISLCLSATVWADAPALKDRPNVVVILADDLGFSDLGCYGGEIPTPNLDRLARGGARFSAFYTSARCCPSRASLMTGLHPHQAGIGSFATAEPERGNGPAYLGHLLPTCVTMAEVLGDAGYSTWMVGKWHMGIPGPIERGFQNYYGFKNFLAYAEDQWQPDKYVRLPEGRAPEIQTPADAFYATDVFTEYALEFLKQARAQDRPYFLYLAEGAPHFPVQAPKKDVDRHMETYRRGWDALRTERLERQKALGLFPPGAELPPRSMVPVDRDDVANGFSGRPNPAWDSLPADRREDLARRMATYAAMVEHVDSGVGRIIDDLKKNGELENTLILFLSDNGACYEWGPFGFDGPSRQGTTTLHTGAALEDMGQPGTHHAYGSGWANLCNSPLNMYKHFCHEGGISDPLIVHWPARIRQSGAWRSVPAHLMDLLPTVMEAADARYPATRGGRSITPVEGVSLLPALDGAATPERSLAFEHQDARGLRRGKWKITWGKRQPTEPSWALYDLERDRSEQHDLAAAHPEILKELAAEWDAWARRVGCKPFVKPDDSADAADGSPRIDGRPLRIEARVDVGGKPPKGVVVAQGGRQHGYALHFLDGRPTFDVRVNGKVSRLSAPAPAVGRVALVARLDRKTFSLAVDGGEAVVGPSPGLIPVQPLDSMDVGHDSRTAAGDYEAPNRFSGKVLDVRVVPGDFHAAACAGDYPRHLQGVCTDGREALFWSFTTELVKTDRDGAVVKKIDVAAHHGDLCHHDGKLYVAVNLGKFNDPKGNADSWVYVYSADDLALLEKRETPEVFHGAGGIAFHDGRFMVVGGLPDDADENYVYEYDADFKFVKRHALDSGHTRLGIQTAAFADDAWWFGCYGAPAVLLKADVALKHVERFDFDASLGLVPIAPGAFLAARGGTTKDQRRTGRLERAEIHKGRGLKGVETR